MINLLKKAWRWFLADDVGEEMEKTIARGVEPISKERINEIASEALKKVNAEHAEQDKQMFDKYRDVCTRKDVWTNKGGVWRQVCRQCYGNGSGLFFDSSEYEDSSGISSLIYKHKECPRCQVRGWVKESLTNTNN